MNDPKSIAEKVIVVRTNEYEVVRDENGVQCCSVGYPPYHSKHTGEYRKCPLLKYPDKIGSYSFTCQEDGCIVDVTDWNPFWSPNESDESSGPEDIHIPVLRPRAFQKCIIREHLQITTKDNNHM